MTTATLPQPTTIETVADLVERLGDIPLHRIRLIPTPGTATEQDLIEYQAKLDRLFELVDGTLVEKAMGIHESRIAALLIQFLGAYLDADDIAVVLAPDGMVRTEGIQVREPDVSVYLWSRFPGEELPDVNVLEVTPDLAVEVLSRSNTVAEMARKRREYFAGQTRMVWEIHPRRRTVRVYRSVDEFTEMDETQTLDGGDVLPGFTVPLRDLFDRSRRRRRR